MTELVRSGARKLIEQALEVESPDLLSEHAGRREEHGRPAVFRSVLNIALSWPQEQTDTIYHYDCRQLLNGQQVRPTPGKP